MQGAFGHIRSPSHRDVSASASPVPVWPARAFEGTLPGVFPCGRLWHMHSLGVLLCMFLLFLEPAPHMYTYAFLHYAVGWFMSLFWFLFYLCMSLPLEPLHEP